MDNRFAKTTIFTTIGANLLVLALALVYHWSALTLLWSYWCESIILIFFHRQKKRSEKRVSWWGYESNFLSYVFLHIGYLTILMILSLLSTTGGGYLTSKSGKVIGHFTLEAPDFWYVALGAGIFFLSHLFSFLVYREKRKGIDTLGARIAVMHVTIIIGVIITVKVSSVWLLPIFIGIKTISDLHAHITEHWGGYAGILK